MRTHANLGSYQAGHAATAAPPYGGATEPLIAGALDLLRATLDFNCVLLLDCRQRPRPLVSACVGSECRSAIEFDGSTLKALLAGPYWSDDAQADALLSQFEWVTSGVGIRAWLSQPVSESTSGGNALQAAWLLVAVDWRVRPASLERSQRLALGARHLENILALRTGSSGLSAHLGQPTEPKGMDVRWPNGHLDHLPVALIQIDPQGSILAMNRAAQRLFGLSLECAAVGQALRQFLPDWEGNARPATPDASFTGRHFEMSAQRADASTFIADVLSSSPDDCPAGSQVLAVVDVSWRRHAQQALERALLEKTALLSEVHHRVKNNLQVMSSLLSLQAHACDEPEARTVLVDSQRRVTAMGLTHQLLYEHGDLSRVDLPDYLDRLVRVVLDSLLPDSERISLLLDLAPATLVLRRCVPFGLLVNELITNAVKHAYPGGRRGVLRLRLHHQLGRRLSLAVADDGVGLPEDYPTRANSSLGGQLISVLAEQLGAQLSISQSGGTTCEVSFPMDPLVAGRALSYPLGVSGLPANQRGQAEQAGP